MVANALRERKLTEEARSHLMRGRHDHGLMAEEAHLIIDQALADTKGDRFPQLSALRQAVARPIAP